MCECVCLYLDAPDSIVLYQSYLEIKVSHINMNLGADDDNNRSKKMNKDVRVFFPSLENKFITLENEMNKPKESTL